MLTLRNIACIAVLGAFSLSYAQPVYDENDVFGAIGFEHEITGRLNAGIEFLGEFIKTRSDSPDCSNGDESQRYSPNDPICKELKRLMHEYGKQSPVGKGILSVSGPNATHSEGHFGNAQFKADFNSVFRNFGKKIIAQDSRYFEKLRHELEMFNHVGWERRSRLPFLTNRFSPELSNSYQEHIKSLVEKYKRANEFIEKN